MSSSVDSDTGSFHDPAHHRPDKRAPSPDDDHLALAAVANKKFRSGSDDQHTPALDPATWSSTNGSVSPQPHDDAHRDSVVDDLSPRVQLPSLASTFQDRHELRRASLPTLYSESATRLRLPTPTHRPSQSSSGLSSYTFPPVDSSDDKLTARPRLAADTQLTSLYPSEYSLSSSLSSASSFSFSPSPLASDYKPSPSGLVDDHWAATGIVRPNSSPDTGLRHSIGTQQQLFGGITRISGHSHHLTDRSGRLLKPESDWAFPGSEFAMSSSSAAGVPSSQSMTGSPTRSPQQAPGVAPVSSLVERPPRKRGKLPKPVTDFLKDWLHRHSDHPYPSEEEKKQLCHATGLSMSQVSNWMINVRTERLTWAPVQR